MQYSLESLIRHIMGHKKKTMDRAMYSPSPIRGSPIDLDDVSRAKRLLSKGLGSDLHKHDLRKHERINGSSRSLGYLCFTKQAHSFTFCFLAGYAGSMMPKCDYSALYT
ncbi:hypothetical protein KP509_02G091300 [Ceratopteris richardii]|uniref:Uncharacterized protein n=1 Tax=Ceratopteris richardii TaxID=49495 RepID=A0A8T2VC59_CERRI|nr:hypothetical protein KP509_02G091300 [Ceratopteris richardii]